MSRAPIPHAEGMGMLEIGRRRSLIHMLIPYRV
jgi:hypothetical protein